MDGMFSDSMRFTTFGPTPVGTLTLVADTGGQALAACLFERDRHYGPAAGVVSSMARDDALPVLAEGRSWLAHYFAGERPAPGELPLNPRGTDFQLRVWRELARIPYGATLTYGEVARRLEAQVGRRQSSRAVGGAVGRNPLCVIVPCHRVVGADGNLTGFGGGIAAKVRLLEHEGVDMSRMHVPTRGTAL